MVIGPSGELYKCWNDVGVKEREIGNITSKEILNENLLLKYYTDADPLTDRTCLACKLMPVCNGGCPYKRIETTNSDSNSFCLLIKENEDEFIKNHIQYLTLQQQYIQSTHENK